MAIANYTDLKSAVATWLHRSDLSAIIVDLITLGEAHLNRVVRTPSMETTTTIPTGSSSRFLAIPAGYRDVLHLSYLGVPLTQYDAERVSLLAEIAPVGLPRYYAITSQIELDKITDKSYSLNAVLFKPFDIAADVTNWLLTRHPDTYVFSALAEAAPYLEDDARVPLWIGKRDAAIRETMNYESRRRRSSLRSDLPVYRPFNIING